MPSKQKNRLQTKIDARPQIQGNDSGIKDSIKDLKLQMEQMNFKIQNLEKALQEEGQKNSKNILKAFNGLSEVLHNVNGKIQQIEVCTKQLDEKINQMDLKVKEADNLAFKLQNEIDVIQYYSMENALRLRGIPENYKENLIQKCSKALAKLLETKEEEIIYKITKCYRVNSWFAKQRNLPRDVVIYFTGIKMRNDIAARSFFSKMYIEGKQIIVFKETPSRILRLRKEFRFLADELKKRSVLFRWEVPVGMSLNYGGQYYKLNTIEKAKVFYSDILKVGNFSSSSRSVLEATAEEKLQMTSECFQESEQKLMDQEDEEQTGLNECLQTLGSSNKEELLDEVQPIPPQIQEPIKEIQAGTIKGEEFFSKTQFKCKSYTPPYKCKPFLLTPWKKYQLVPGS